MNYTMGRLSGFRPPQFSEEDTWLPCWLQQCSGEWLDVSMNEDHVTFEQRVEELLCPQKDINNGDSLRGEGGWNISQLFISGTDSSPFSCAQSANSVVQFHLCLSSDGDSEDSALSTDACDTEPNFLHMAQPRNNLESSGQKDANLSTFQDAGAVNGTQTAELERHVNKNELLKHDDNVNFCEAASDAVELCIAASEALVINEVIGSDSFEKYSSASAILEASLQLKQARLEVWKNTFADSLSVISDMDNLSDLDDMTMESVYEDAGIHFTELPGNELSVSQVNDTLESEHDDELEHEKAGASARIHDLCGNYNYGNDIELRNDLPTAYCDSDVQNKVVCSPVCDLGTDIGHFDDCSRTVGAHANNCLSVSAEEINTLTPENNPRESHVSSSPMMSCRDGEEECCQPNIVQENFRSRWLGGWSSNNKVNYTAQKCRIPEPFVGQTSFLSESADTAPDVNSFVQNLDKHAIIASQLSIPSEIFSNRANDGMLLSQDVGSPCASLLDPLCSFVPSSIPENLCSSPAINYGDLIFPITNEYEKDNVLDCSFVPSSIPGNLCSSPAINYGDPIFPIRNEYERDNVLDSPSAHKTPVEGEKIVRRTADNNDSGNEVSRRSTSLRDYSMLLPSHSNLFGNDSHQKSVSLIERNPKLTFQETFFSYREEAVKAGAEQQVPHKEVSAHTLSPEVNHRTEPHFRTSFYSKHNFAEEHPIGTAQPESIVKHLPCENLQPQSAQKLPARKRVHFSERETDIPENNKIRKLQAGYSTRAAERLTRSGDLESRAQQMGRFLRNLDKKKKRLIFQNMEFLLTGLSPQKEKEIEGLIRKYGGMVISQIPPTNSKGKRSSMSKSRALPVVICLKKTQSFKFLYGCAVNAYVLRVNWLIDSIAAGFVLQPKRYMVLPRNMNRNDQVYTAVKYNTHSLVFNNLGVMLHGKTKYLANITTILKHGGGQVFKTLQGLIQTLETGRISMGVVVTDEESCASRQLIHYAMEHNVPMTSVNWIVKCLYAGQLTPLEEKRNSRCSPAIKLQRLPEPMELSQEI